MNKIAQLNDNLRQNLLSPGKDRVFLTVGVSSLSVKNQMLLLNQVKNFNDFTPDNDVYGEHDFGKISLFDTDYFWKIDYYDTDCEYSSEDPSNPDITTRLLTIMRADEY